MIEKSFFQKTRLVGFVWDDKLLSEELNKPNQEQGQEQDKAEIKEVNAGTNVGSIERSRSNGGGRGYRTGKVSPAIDPPSPKVSACGFCGAFGKPGDKQGQRPKPGKRRSR
ncbi:hypothetical protein L6164_021597 [Bauhinia variegata]|uniref:Uncharacterized protein n=1 Tax=Bauhinia variegata TaxID=167791 RepID=A0ACB9N4R0_BAUVA|nr:hypothetical protein L6164_021597 [Bauhinia variegata]